MARALGPDRRISLAPLTVVELTPPETVGCAAAAGFDAVGLRLIPATPQEPKRPTIGMTPMIREARRRLDDTGLELIDIEVLRLTPDTDVRADYLEFLETGAYLGARQILVAGNDPDRARMADRFAELAALAALFGLTPNIEPMPYNDIGTVAQAVAVLRAAGHPNAGILIDALHFDRGGNTVAELNPLPRSWFNYVQLCDAPAEQPADRDALVYQSRSARQLPGQGGLDLDAMLHALPADLPVSVEAPIVAPGVPALERARAALRHTRAVVDRADGRGYGTARAC
ncbi:sugar phosphate isomerase/epimerase [Mycobacterium sp. PS03-16]|uniref:sugar phosphate isomerase/epimerase family protein n=1 Tax=Mycobacterium sp. PS03-16 TaxID=2559611 RepID=UPI001073D354|nr:TIM barrel protein [Mycobacterium sp. PS03-16]TFV58915.1 sugar phosphate isomerase/epimerase [Mycobacterium sp. PS03-16]